MGRIRTVLACLMHIERVADIHTHSLREYRLINTLSQTHSSAQTSRLFGVSINRFQIHKYRVERGSTQSSPTNTNTPSIIRLKPFCAFRRFYCLPPGVYAECLGQISLQRKRPWLKPPENALSFILLLLRMLHKNHIDTFSIVSRCLECV